MDANGIASRSAGEISMMESTKSPGEVAAAAQLDTQPLASKGKAKVSFDSQHRVSFHIASPETFRDSPSPNKPPKIPTNSALTWRKSFSRSVYSKPKSRFGEQCYAFVDTSILEENNTQITEERGEPSFSSPYKNSSNQASPYYKTGSNVGPSFKETKMAMSTAPKTLLMASPGGFGVDEDEEIYKKVISRRKLRSNREKTKVLIEWIVLLCVVGFLIASLTVHKLRHCTLWGLEIWKWCTLVIVTFGGMLFTKCLIRFAVLLIEHNFLLKKKVLYFVYALKKSLQVFIWLSLVLVTWLLLFRKGVERSHSATRILDYVTRTIVTLLIGAFLWLLKTLLLKMLASSFHVNAYFDRIQESVFHQYVLQTLSQSPVMANQMLSSSSSSSNQFSVHTTKKGKDGKEKKEKGVIDINKLHEMKREKVSAWTTKMLVNVVSNSGLTVSDAVDEIGEQSDKEITNEKEAIAAAREIFRNVTQPTFHDIDKHHLRRFMIKEEVDLVFPMIAGAESGEISENALIDWVVKVYNGRKALFYALNDTKTVVKQLDKLVTAILIVIVVIVWLLLIEIATTGVIVILSSNIVAAAFMFGDTCKAIFEAIIFVFVRHPFDVGDRCVVDGVQMIVEEMDILTTVFLRYDNEKIYYPNSILSTKQISNFNRSPDMGDCIEFSIDCKTPLEKIGALEDEIKKYIKKNTMYWHPGHSVLVKAIEDTNKIKMAVHFNHTMNFQDFEEMNRRRSKFVLEMKKMFEVLGIKYDLLLQDHSSF